MFLKKPAEKWLEWHYLGMCWSYVGLAAAAAAEFFTRVPRLWPSIAGHVPPQYFWIALGACVAVLGGLGTYLIRIRKLGFPVVHDNPDAVGG